MDKKALRKSIKQIRNSLPESERKSQSILICKKLLELDEYKKANKILSFMNFGSEIEIENFNQEVLKNGKKLYLPRVEKDGTLSVIEHGTGFSIGVFGIREPIGEIYMGELDLIVTPGLAFDRDGNRLGYGKGYYDKLFIQHTNSVKIAPIFDIQLVEKVPNEEHDMKVDILITKNEVLKVKKY
ncbi:MAG: 5-formyltetrahydrofolate cyclo-ligase [Fusobacterium sp.]|nr:5-formyltetrahydrofolate cyclo-ligase [Fusobacterium sp.]MDO5788731.1 5-formyltetrahydrofolate cyclo-ligase [Fusobacterium sp.]